MKEWLRVNLLVIVLVLIVISGIATLVWAAGTNTVTVTENTYDPVYQITFTWTGDASDGSVPNASTPSLLGSVCMAVTNPGATAPTDNYDIVLNDADGVDIFGGELANRDTANTEQAVPKVGNGYGCRHVKGALTMVTSNQSVTSATGTLTIDIWKDRY